MKKHIAEDLPARKFPQASLSKDNQKSADNDKGEQGSKSPEQKVRQAVYDIRYRARREDIPLRQAYTQYMQNSSLAEQEKSLVREKLFGKGGIVKENYIEDVSKLASISVAKTLYKVFAEKKDEDINIDNLKNELEEASHLNKYNKGSDRKYKVRVTDKNGTSYVRFASREKINSLRSNPNIQSVEMTEYGEPYEGEKNKGERTAAAKSGKDWDGDGKKESPAKEHAGVVHNAIQRKRGGTPDGKDTSNVKEEFIGEVTDNNSIIDVKGKKKPNKITVYHNGKTRDEMTENAYSKFLGLLNERKMKEFEVQKEKQLKSKYDDSQMKKNMIDQYGKDKGTKVYFATIRKQAMKEESCDKTEPKNLDMKDSSDDIRSIPTKVNLFKNKLRATGIKI